MTNLEILKAEIAEMSAEEFEEACGNMLQNKKYRNLYCKSRQGIGCPSIDTPCEYCRVKWLNEESEVKE